jgi:hypothetical protein
MLATGVSLTAAATIALAPLPAEPLPSTQTAPVALTGAWQDLETNTRENLAGLSAWITNYPGTPILSQLASNATTYSRWLQFQDGGTPLKVVQTVGQHVVAVGATLASYLLFVPLSFVGPLIAPGVMIAQLIADTAAYPSTPQTVLQAFIDAPAVYLDTTLNCCGAPLLPLSLGLLNPGPLGYLLSLRPGIATALQIPTPSWLVPDFSPRQVPAAPAAPAAAQEVAPAPAVATSGRVQPDTTGEKTDAPRSSKRAAAVRKGADSGAKKAASGGQGRSARPHR